MFDLARIQSALRQFQLDAWLLYDFRGGNVLARRVLELDSRHISSRRFCYAIPAEGEPVKLVHRIESGTLDHLPGRKIVYLKWQELEAGLAEQVAGHARVAMEYSPRNANPYVSKVDAGTVELIRALGVEVVSSGDLIQQFEAVWSTQQWELHQQAGAICDDAFARAWALIVEKVRAEGGVEEQAVSECIMRHFHEHGAATYHPPIVARPPHSGNPHYETGGGDDTLIRENDFVLIDLWAKLDRPGGVYADMTRVGYVGADVPDRYESIFQIVARARDAAIDCVETAFAQGRPLQGWEVDAACREVIEQAGYGDRFVHRTGHSIGEEVHGNGAHMDNLEMKEDRLVLPGTCFSIEPGIYLDDFGVRSEVDLFVDWDGKVHVTYGEPQTRVLPLFGGSAEHDRP
jgi:Xaa-Pro dipeptidase